MLSCADIEVLLSDYADGSTNPRTRRIVEQHVQLCERCRRRVQMSRQVALQLRRLPLLPTGVSSRVARFRRRLEAQTTKDRRRLEHYPFYVSVVLASLLIAITLLTLFYLGV